MMELEILLCIILIPLAVIVVTIIIMCKRRQLKRAKMAKRQKLYISTVQNCYLQNNTNLQDPNRRGSNLSTFDISTINIEEQIAAYTLYESNQPNQSIHSIQTDVRENVPEYTKPPAYNPNYC